MNSNNRRLRRHPISTRTCRACSNCITMSSTRSTYNQLMSIDLKYLKLYLSNLNTPGIENLTDKSQLVDLLINKRNETSPTSETTCTTSNRESEMIDETNQKHLKFKASLSDLTSLDDIEKLNNKRIKQILASNFVHYKTTSDRGELVSKLKNLFLANEDNKRIDTKQMLNSYISHSSNSTQDVCKICMEYVIDCVLVDCGHMVVCSKW